VSDTGELAMLGCIEDVGNVDSESHWNGLVML
jgi:hypothetical protein